MTKPKRPYATNTKRRSVTITDSDWQALKKLGNGNASAGIREALGFGESNQASHPAGTGAK